MTCRWWALLGVLLAVPGCTSSDRATPTPTPAPSMSPVAEQYLVAALNLMQQHSIRRADVDWPKIRAQALAESRGARTPADTYPAIRLSLLSLDDDHSALVPPAQQTEPATPPMPAGRSLAAGRVGYLRLPATPELRTVTGKAQLQHYIDRAQGVLRGTACGWVLDLRDNNGGDGWPMLAAITPLLTTGVVGYFVAPPKPRDPWRVSAGRAYDGSHLLARASEPVADRAPPPVAVLTGPRTGSAGELVTIAFRGQAMSRSFGAATAGVPSARTGYRLSDGADLFITDAADADRTGHVYGLTQRITPDQPTSSADKNRVDPDPSADLTAAVAWLTAQTTCRG